MISSPPPRKKLVEVALPPEAIITKTDYEQISKIGVCFRSIH